MGLTVGLSVGSPSPGAVLSRPLVHVSRHQLPPALLQPPPTSHAAAMRCDASPAKPPVQPRLPRLPGSPWLPGASRKKNNQGEERAPGPEPGRDNHCASGRYLVKRALSTYASLRWRIISAPHLSPPPSYNQLFSPPPPPPAPGSSTPRGLASRTGGD